MDLITNAVIIGVASTSSRRHRTGVGGPERRGVAKQQRRYGGRSAVCTYQRPPQSCRSGCGCTCRSCAWLSRPHDRILEAHEVLDTPAAAPEAQGKGGTYVISITSRRRVDPLVSRIGHVVVRAQQPQRVLALLTNV